MLDRESHNDNTTVQWSTDGSSFIIMDQQEFEEVSSTIISIMSHVLLSTDVCRSD